MAQNVIASHAEIARVGVDDFFGVFGKDKERVYNQTGWKKIRTTQEFHRMYQEGGFSYAVTVNEATPIPTDDFFTGNNKDYYWIKKGLGFRTSFEALETDQYGGKIKSATKKMAIAMNKTKESTAANVWNNMTSTGAQFVGPDGVALVSASHPFDGGTWSNHGTGPNNSAVDLSAVNVEQALAKLSDTLDQRGIPDPKNGPFDLHVPNELYGLALRIARSMQLQGTANNDTNQYISGVINNVVREPWWTDADAWTLVASDSDEHGLIELNHGSRRVQTKTYEETEEVAFFVTEKWLFHHFDARGVWGSPGA